ncbi:hypothetical protein BDK51DRAFT_51277 [Blyttiomyces helicus]|uniref:Uncharacterized protein n=1 Tax=Blyttiomyces helicus TaxID=388810 RepID=A0A4P9W443_9FUNG|nr:hypothetical protein BDK51DRAFT_51277 [Blyttiomyces helicus]|eukprot:RKO85430.1 hypothetical protein BDK51DRAFT_51277 [Blyttiomyces helicus]
MAAFGRASRDQQTVEIGVQLQTNPYNDDDSNSTTSYGPRGSRVQQILQFPAGLPANVQLSRPKIEKHVPVATRAMTDSDPASWREIWLQEDRGTGGQDALTMAVESGPPETNNPFLAFAMMRRLMAHEGSGYLPLPLPPTGLENAAVIEDLGGRSPCEQSQEIPLGRAGRDFPIGFFSGQRAFIKGYFIMNASMQKYRRRSSGAAGARFSPSGKAPYSSTSPLDVRTFDDDYRNMLFKEHEERA